MEIYFKNLKSSFQYLNRFGGINHERSHDVRTVIFVSSTERTDDDAKVKGVLVADNAKLEGIISAALNNGRVTHVNLRHVNTSDVLFVRNSFIDTFGKFRMFNFL